MSGFTGIVMLVLAVNFYVKYSPRSQNGRALCIMMGTMGVMALLSSPGIWEVQLVQLVLQVVVGFCCFAQLKKEKSIRERRRAASRHVHRTRIEAQHNIETCA